MIEKITIKNFKSLVDVKIELGQFNCFVGMNGAGKSTLLQALDFISQQMHGFLYSWLDSRGWTSKDLYSRTGGLRAAHQGISLAVHYRLQDGSGLIWGGNFNRTSMRLTREFILLGDKDSQETVLEVIDGKCKLPDQQFPIPFEYQGSVLSQLKDSVLPASVREFRDAIRNIRSLELLSPHLLRKRSRTQDKDIGAGGEKLSGFLGQLNAAEKERLLSLLQKFYPRLQNFRVATVKGGWKRLAVSESYNMTDGLFPGKETTFETEASQLNDGLLRILAILAQAASQSSSLLLLDEVENGINPEIIEKLVDTLVQSPMQVIVTTHSPMILNYLEDDIARKAVQFVYKSPEGHSQVRRFFDIPRINDKLSYMGPGEAFVDTNLQELSDECVSLDIQKAVEKSNSGKIAKSMGA
ncbi:MAG: AAA family ATPase [Enterobacterales bacterium]|uniref:AAA family ATPase n=1 Tax=Serratia sp. (in: enterobacteria) TaxID=616 RepID=UPI003F413191